MSERIGRSSGTGDPDGTRLAAGQDVETRRELWVAVRTLGCKVNRAESESIATELLGAGVELVEPGAAAIVIINTCTVTAEADVKARKAIRKALATASEPVVVVTGCLAALDPEGLRSISSRVIVEAAKERVPALVREILGVDAGHRAPAREPVRAPAVAPLHAPSRAPEPPLARDGGAFRTRAALKIQDGCDAFCAYCIVPYARGVPRAVSFADVVAQARRLVSAGVREIVLTGINVGRYRDTGLDLADVVQAVASTGVPRVRLSSIEPLDLTPRLLEAMAGEASFCAHLHIPLQSASDGVLSAMGRGYGSAQFEERLIQAREALPGLVVTTDVLAGFPGETQKQAAETLAFCERAGFAKLHVFRYSQRPGTAAASRTDQVADAEKSARAAALRELSSRLVASHATARIGDVAEVLVERVVRADASDPRAEGTTRDYLRVSFAARGVHLGELAQVRIASADGDAVLGERLA